MIPRAFGGLPGGLLNWSYCLRRHSFIPGLFIIPLLSLCDYWAIDIMGGIVYCSYSKREVELMQAYCVKCRTKREMKDTKAITMKNGKPATQGVCPVCGTKMFRIGKG